MDTHEQSLTLYVGSRLLSYNLTYVLQPKSMITHLNRRKFLQRFLVIGSAGTIVIGCSDSGEDEANIPSVSENLSDGFHCSDTSALTEAEVSVRNTFEYIDQSAIEDKNCANCTLYVMPEPGDSCGGCLTIKGPIHPQGYCTLWAAQTG